MGIFFNAQNWLTGIHKVVIIDCLEYDYEQTRRTDIGPGLVHSDIKGVSVVHSVCPKTPHPPVHSMDGG